METFQAVVKIGKEKQREDTSGNINNQIRCSHCNKLLFKGDFKGVVEIQCTRCKKLIKVVK